MITSQQRRIDILRRERTFSRLKQSKVTLLLTRKIIVYGFCTET